MKIKMNKKKKMPTIKKAIEIAIEAHKDQKDKSGESYLGHIFRVMNMGRTEEEKICGALHDVVEDTDMTFDDLRSEGFSERIIEALVCLTKKSENEDYAEFIGRIAKNRLAVNVKLNDLTDNMDIRRIETLNEHDIVRLNKYLRAYRYLTKIASEESKT